MAETSATRDDWATQDDAVTTSSITILATIKTQSRWQMHAKLDTLRKEKRRTPLPISRLVYRRSLPQRCFGVIAWALTAGRRILIEVALLKPSTDALLRQVASAPDRCPVPAHSQELLARVLLVEDNAISQLVTIQQLRQLACVPTTVASCADALEALRHRHFPLILLDCRMPEVDGYQTARAIRDFERSAGRERSAIVAITADCDVECVDKCLAAGMDGHVNKPTSVEMLRAIFERYLV